MRLGDGGDDHCRCAVDGGYGPGPCPGRSTLSFLPDAFGLISVLSSRPLSLPFNFLLQAGSFLRWHQFCVLRPGDARMTLWPARAPLRRLPVRPARFLPRLKRAQSVSSFHPRRASCRLGVRCFYVLRPGYLELGCGDIEHSNLFKLG